MAKIKGRLLTGSVKKTLIKMTLPMMAGMLSMVVFNLVDTFYVGKLGVEQLAAMGFTFPVVLAVNSIALGMGIAASSIISRAIGRGDHHEVVSLASNMLLIGFMTVVVITTIGLLTIEPLFALLGAKGSILGMVKQYMVIWYWGVPFVVMPMMGNNMLRATGDSKTPGITMTISMFINLLVDPLLIFGLGPFPAMGLQGAAVTTVFSRAISMVISLTILIKREHMIVLSSSILSSTVKTAKQLFYISIPATATRLIVPLSMAVITRMIAQYGNPAVAGFGVASRIEMFAMMITRSLGSVLMPFVGQNWGARNIDRIRDAMRFSDMASIAWGFVVFIVSILFARPIASLFNSSPEVINITAYYLYIVSFTFGLFGVTELNSIGLNALNKPIPSTIISFVRMFILYIPLAVLGSKLFEIKGIFSAAALTNIITGIFAYFVFNYILRQMIAGEHLKGRENIEY